MRDQPPEVKVKHGAAVRQIMSTYTMQREADGIESEVHRIVGKLISDIQDIERGAGKAWWKFWRKI